MCPVRTVISVVDAVGGTGPSLEFMASDFADQAEFLLTERNTWNVVASRAILENATAGGSCGATVAGAGGALAREVLRRRRSESPSNS